MMHNASPIPVRPPSRHELAAVIWLAVPIVMYGLMPQLLRARAALLRRR